MSAVPWRAEGPVGRPPGRDARVLAVLTRARLPERTLTRRERATVRALSGEERQRQWLISRFALRLLLGMLGEPADSAGYAFPHPWLSLSHTRGAAAAAAAAYAGPALAGVGVDVGVDAEADADAVRARTVRPDAGRFFLGDRERDWLAGLPEAERADELARLWTVKEALFKADPANARTTLADYLPANAAARQGRAGRRGGEAEGEGMGEGGAVFGYATGHCGDTWLTVAAAFHRRSGSGSGSEGGGGGGVPEPWAPAPAPSPPSPSVTFDEVAARVGATLSLPVERLTPATTLRELAAESFLLVEMAVDLEEEGDDVRAHAGLREVTTLGDLARLLGRP
ncbi:4'-phosphopantetheinyl transferase superfamily protein [Streptomyces sp. NPDC054796]